jgi:DNA replication and repair protein RecF
MYLKKISLFNYKNFSEANFEFDGKIICFVGKTVSENVLDAIYHLSYGKRFQSTGSPNIKHGEEFFVIDAEFIKNERNEQVVCSFEKKVVLKRNGKAYDKFSDHVGFIPLVIISPRI